MKRLVSFQHCRPRGPGRQRRLADCAVPAGRHLQFRGCVSGRLHPEHLHPQIERGEDRLHRAIGERDRADHDRVGRCGLAADDLPPPAISRRSSGAARHPEPVDTSTSHVSFRCVVRGPVSASVWHGARLDAAKAPLTIFLVLVRCEVGFAHFLHVAFQKKVRITAIAAQPSAVVVVAVSMATASNQCPSTRPLFASNFRQVWRLSSQQGRSSPWDETA